MSASPASATASSRWRRASGGRGWLPSSPLLRPVSLNAVAGPVAATAALWAIGWAVTAGAGIDSAEQWLVFGASGALVVAFLQSLFIKRVLPIGANTGKSDRSP